MPCARPCCGRLGVVSLPTPVYPRAISRSEWAALAELDQVDYDIPMSTEMHNLLGAPEISGFQPKATDESPSGVSAQDTAEDFGRIDLPRPRRVLTVEFVHVGRRPVHVSEHWED